MGYRSESKKRNERKCGIWLDGGAFVGTKGGVRKGDQE